MWRTPRYYSINGKEPLVMTCVWGMFWHMSGHMYEWYQVRSGFMVEDANTSGHVFRKLRLGQRAIAKKTLGTRDDMIRPDRIITCDDWPAQP